MEEHTYVEQKTTKERIRIQVFLFCAVFLFSAVFIGLTQINDLNNPPLGFPTRQIIEIPSNSSLRDVLEILAENKVVRSKLYTKYHVHKQNGENTIKAGLYYFENPISSQEVVEAILNGTHQSDALTLTLPEGFTAKNIEEYLPDGYSQDVNENLFIPYEGYLFPDTYFITTDMTPEELRSLLTSTFDEKIALYQSQIDTHGLKKDEVIVLASILEREANTEESMRIVSGILQNRLDIDMALQVDATFDYLLGKSSDELTQEDLEIESPYNTYTNRGLPPTPIANPGLLAIDAVLNPIKTDYLYYLTGNDGKFYYATTFEEHRDNKFKYLR